ncbi:MAG: hypothetical protein JWP69_1119 [Flaviaesturariibacter sp.]|nr:hypothetical protein [Flaviaesturariibacter sp.]
MYNFTAMKRPTEVLNQEKIYRLLAIDAWAAIIKLLSEHREEIKLYDHLHHAIRTFENVFFNKISDLVKTDSDISLHLERLYSIHTGGYFELQDVHFQKLLVELIRHRPPKEAYNYARLLKDKELAAKILNQDAGEGNVSTLSSIPFKINLSEWNEIFNRIFAVINNTQHPATSISGYKFIQYVHELDEFFPTLDQFLDERKASGLSLSKKSYFYDIFMHLDERKRYYLAVRILDVLKPFAADKMHSVEYLLGMVPSKPINTSHNSGQKHSKTIVSITYAWESEAHRIWVKTLAKRLEDEGIEVLYDQNQIHLGSALQYSMEQFVEKADRVLIIFSPSYKTKADQRKGGAGYEYSILNTELYEEQILHNKFIPILRLGSRKESIPTFMRQYVYLDMSSDNSFEENFKTLLSEIQNSFN